MADQFVDKKITYMCVNIIARINLGKDQYKKNKIQSFRRLHKVHGGGVQTNEEDF